MTWLDTLVSWFASFANTAAIWEYTASTWSWPLNTLYGFFIALSDIADGMFSGMLDFRTWLYALVDDLSEVFSWQSILDWLEDRVADINGVIAWIDAWETNVGYLVSKWWEHTGDTVKSWIATATQGLADMIAAWDDFVTVTLPTLFDLDYAEEWWLDKLVSVGQLISSAFVDRADLWAGWTDFRARVSEFFSTPFTWLEARFIDWFLGGE